MLLELRNIKRYFTVKRGFMGKSRSLVKAVDNIDLSINKGENISLVGESGCGKTTLARLILKLLPLDSGTMIFDGIDITELNKSRFQPYRKHMQIVFQDPHSSLDPRFTVRNIIKEAFTLDQMKYQSEQEKEQRICELIKAVQLDSDMLSRYPHEFSGGERQRIAIARALVLNPKLLILDEAVSSLDVIIQQQLLDLLLKLQKQFALTYLFISHNLKVVKKISQKIAVMYKGKIVEIAPCEELFANPIHPYTQELLSAAVHYTSLKREQDFEVHPSAKLVNQGNDHFVIGK